MSAIRDLVDFLSKIIEDYLGLDVSLLSDLTTVYTYYAEFLLHLLKFGVDGSRIVFKRSIPEISFLKIFGIDSVGIGYILSGLENLIKAIRAFIKGGAFISIPANFEKGMRLTFTIMDFIEDALVLIYPDIVRYS